MRHVIFTLLLFLFQLSVFSQSVGDYQSKQSGSWGDAANWQWYNGTAFVDAAGLPSATTGIVTIRDGHAITVNNEVKAGLVIVVSGGILNWNGGSLDANLTNNGTINQTGTSDWGYNTAATLVVNNNGTYNWNNGDIYFRDVILNNNAGASIIVKGDNGIPDWGTANLLNNAGTFTKQSGSGTTNIYIPWQNSGTVTIDQGTVQSGGLFTNTGIINMSNGSVLTNSNTLNWNSGSQLKGNGIFNNSNIVNLNSNLTLPPTITLNATAGNFMGTNTLTINGVLNWSGGSLDANLTNNGTINQSGNVDWGLNAAATLVVNNNGTYNWDVGDIYFRDVILNNNAGANIIAKGDNVIPDWGTTNLLNNAGTFTKQSGSGTTNIYIPWQNSGTVNIDQGTLQNSGILTNTGTFNMATGRTFTNTGTLYWNIGSQLNGSFNLNNSGVFNIAIDLIIPNAIPLTISGGNFGGSGKLTVNSIITWSGGNISTSLLTINNILNWSGGGLDANLTNNGTINQSGTVDWGYNMAATLSFDNNGTYNWNNGDIYFRDVILNNNAGANIIAKGDNGIPDWGTANLLNNAGTFTKQSGSGTTNIYIPWQNSGTVNIDQGTVQSGGLFTNTGIINMSNGSVLTNSNTLNWNSGSQLKGNGIFNNSNIVNLNSNLTLPPTITLNATAGNFMGTNTLTINGVLNWSGGSLDATLTNNGTINQSGTVDWGYNTAATLVVHNNGTYNWDAGDIYFRDVILNNNSGANIIIRGNNGIPDWGTANLLNNAGTLSKQSADITNIYIPWQNSGRVNGIGTIASHGVFTNTGSIEPGISTGILQFTGSQPLSSTSILQIEIKDGTGAGTGFDQLTRNDNLTLAGTLKVVKTGDVPKGTYIIVQVSSGTISGSFATLDLPEGCSITVNPTNVVLNVEDVEIDTDKDGVPDKNDCAPNDATKWRSAELFIDADGDGYDNGKETVCYGANIPEGYAQTTKGADCNDDNAAINPATIWYKDADNDGYSDGATLTQCTQPTGYKLVAQLTAISGDCKDDDAGIHPGAIEICGNGIDEDCDGKDGTCAVVDTDGDGVPDNEDCAPNDATKWRSAELFIDKDGDGYDNGKETVCYGANIPEGYAQTTKGADCNDDNAAINPVTVWYKDADNDGYSDGATLTQCTQPTGYKLVAQLTAISGDCKDDDASIHPGAIEICGNGIDEDCDGKDGTCAVVDTDGDGVPDNEDCAPNDASKWRSETLYIDADGDGYDNGEETVCYGTDVPVGYSQTTKGKDCNDSDAEVNPGAAEQCDGKDNNCDGVTDEGCVPLPKISLSHATVLEGRSGVQYMIFNLRLNHVVDKPITVQYRTVNGTAKAGEDYTEKSGTVTFSANSLVQTIQVAIKGDVMYEDNERFTLELYNATNASIGNSVAIGTIINDDLPPAIKLYDAIVKEDAGFASVRVGLNTASGFPTRIGIKTKNGSAQAPGDYTTVETEVVLQPGETEKWIQIPIIWDYVKEGEERFYVYLSKLDNPALQLIYMFVGLGRAESVVRITNVDRAIDPKSQYLNSERPLEIKVLPNPAPIEFTLQIRDGSAEPVNIVVSDILGRKVENILNQKTNIDIKLGKNYRNGVYIIEVIQGDKRKVVQVMKLQ